MGSLTLFGHSDVYLEEKQHLVMRGDEVRYQPSKTCISAMSFPVLIKHRNVFPRRGSVSLFTQLGQITVEKYVSAESPTCHNASIILKGDTNQPRENTYFHFQMDFMEIM